MKRAVLILILCSSLYSSCAHLPDRDDQFIGNGELLLHILPGTFFGSEELSSIHVTGRGPKNTLFTRQVRQFGESLSIDNLIQGRWKLTGKGIDSRGSVSASASRTVLVSSEGITEKTLRLMPEAAYGTVELQVEGLHKPGLSYQVFAFLQQISNSKLIPFEPVEDYRFFAQAPSGYYLLSAALVSTDGQAIWDGITVVRIFGDTTKQVLLEFTDDLFGKFNHPEPAHLPINLSISGLVPTLQINDSMMLEVHCSPEEPHQGIQYLYLWHITDGLTLVASAGEFLYWAPNIPGKRQLTVIILAVDPFGRISQAGRKSSFFEILPR